MSVEEYKKWCIRYLEDMIADEKDNIATLVSFALNDKKGFDEERQTSFTIMNIRIDTLWEVITAIKDDTIIEHSKE